MAFAFDPRDRVNALNTAVTLGYDLNGRITGVTYPNTVAMSASYDALTGRLSDLAHTLGAADLARFAYSYNAVGSITSIAEPAASARNFGYDALQRLVSGGTTALPETYSYDAEGNRLVSHLSAAHTTDAGNRLIQDDQFDYTYDDNGNLEAKTNRVTLAVTSYSYDAQDQLIRIDFPDTTFATYAYDALGRRIAKDVDDGAGGREVTAYVCNGAYILMACDGGPGWNNFSTAQISSLRQTRLVPPYLAGQDHALYDPWQPWVHPVGIPSPDHQKPMFTRSTLSNPWPSNAVGTSTVSARTRSPWRSRAHGEPTRCRWPGRAMTICCACSAPSAQHRQRQDLGRQLHALAQAGAACLPLRADPRRRGPCDAGADRVDGSLGDRAERALLSGLPTGRVERGKRRDGGRNRNREGLRYRLTNARVQVRLSAGSRGGGAGVFFA
jgi:YD repeat-containing protein